MQDVELAEVRNEQQEAHQRMKAQQQQTPVRPAALEVTPEGSPEQLADPENEAASLRFDPKTPER